MTRKLPKATQLKLEALLLANKILRTGTTGATLGSLLYAHVHHSRITSRSIRKRAVFCTVEVAYAVNRGRADFTVTTQLRYGHPDVWIPVEKSGFTVSALLPGSTTPIEIEADLNECGWFHFENLDEKNQELWTRLSTGLI